MQRLILASTSPQRKALLAGLGVPFDIVPSPYDESRCAERDPAERARILAAEKARAVAVQYPDRVVIGGDTLVVAPDGTLLEKPRDAADAKRMLRLQSGGTSVVHSAVSVAASQSAILIGLSSSTVRFAKLSEIEIDWWVRSKLWEGRSGAFQIDGPGQLMIEHIEGDWTGIVGLPVFLLGQLLRQAGAPIAQA